MGSHRLGRIEEDIKRCFWVKKPEVFVSAIEGYEKTVESVKGLKSAEGFIKRELNAKMKLRKIPALNFVADNSIEHGAHIAKIIEDF